MSYSSELKEELAGVIGTARHCRIAQLAALISCGAHIESDHIEIITENTAVVTLCEKLFNILFGIKTDVSDITGSRRKHAFLIKISFCDETREAFEALKMELPNEVSKGSLPDIKKLTVKKCCRYAFLRGAFVYGGSVSNPDKFYHFEIPCRDAGTAGIIKEMMCELDLDARVVKRAKYHVVYIKEGAQISDILGMMGSRKGLLEFENKRIVREVRGTINRRVNCETANINKTAKASARSIDDINYIKEHMGLQSLPNGLDETAYIRLQYPEATLSELGQMMEPPVGKSGVNHRLRKLGRIADELRRSGGEEK